MKKKNYFVYLIMILVTLTLLFILTLYKQFNVYEIKDSINNKNEKVNIKITTSWGGNDTKTQRLVEILDKFQRDNPNVIITNTSVSGAEFLFTLKTDFAQGNDPDVFGLWPGSDISALIKAGRVADLTGVLNQNKEWHNSFGKAAWRYDTYQKKIYGLPLEIIYECLFINKDLFQKYNIKVPHTYEELLTVVKEFRGKGIIPIAWSTTAEGTYLYQNMVAKLGGKNDVENPIRNGKFNKCYVDALKDLKGLYDLGAFPKDAFTLEDSGRRKLFLDKKAAMIMEGSWFIGPGALSDDDNNIEMIPFPMFKESKAKASSIIYGIGNGDFHMSSAAFKDEAKRKICIKLLKYLTSEEVAKKFSGREGFISNVHINNKNNKPGRLYLDGIKLVKDSKELIGPVDSFIDRNLWENVLLNQIPEVLVNRETPEGVFKNIELNYIK